MLQKLLQKFTYWYNKPSQWHIGCKIQYEEIELWTGKKKI